MNDSGLLRIGQVGKIGVRSAWDRVGGGEEFLVDGDFEVVSNFFVFLHEWTIIDSNGLI
jgi:hypothetical protein